MRRISKVAADDNQTFAVGSPAGIGIVPSYILPGDQNWRVGRVGIELIQLDHVSLRTLHCKNNAVFGGMPCEIGVDVDLARVVYLQILVVACCQDRGNFKSAVGSYALEAQPIAVR